MRKLILGLAVITALFAQNTNAQEGQAPAKSNGFYFRVNGGYNFATSNSQHTTGETPIAIIPYPFYNGTENSSGDLEWETVDVNLGKGISFGSTVGYMFNSHLGAELTADYLLGWETEAKVNLSGGDYLVQTLSSTMFQFKPAFVLTAGYSKINPYSKFGAIIGTGKITQELDYRSGSNLDEIEAEAKGGIAFGFHAGVGVSFNIVAGLSLYGELNMNNLSYSPKEGKLTEYKSNGVDQLPSLDTVQKEYEYTENNPYVAMFGSPSPDPNKPLRAPKTSYNYNTLGINFGVKYSL